MPNLKRIPSNSDLNNQNRKRAATPQKNNLPVRQQSAAKSFTPKAMELISCKQLSPALTPEEKIEKTKLLEEILNDNKPLAVNNPKIPLENDDELQAIATELRGLIFTPEDDLRAEIITIFQETNDLQHNLYKILTKEIQEGQSLETNKTRQEINQKLNKKYSKIRALSQQHPNLKSNIKLCLNKTIRINQYLLKVKSIKQLFIEVGNLQGKIHKIFKNDIQQGQASITSEAQQALYQTLRNQYDKVHALPQQYESLKDIIQPSINTMVSRGNKLTELGKARQSILLAMNMYHAQNSQP